jgi:antitoxin CptB
VDIPPRLRWRCRRGTKELDLVLTRFLEHEYENLDEAGREAFEALLLEQDPDLAGWIWGGVTPPERWRTLIPRIQAVSDIPTPP